MFVCFNVSFPATQFNKSKIKKPSTKKGKEEDDFDLDDDFKELDLFNDSVVDDDDDDF